MAKFWSALLARAPCVRDAKELKRAKWALPQGHLAGRQSLHREEPQRASTTSSPRPPSPRIFTSQISRLLVNPDTNFGLHCNDT